MSLSAVHMPADVYSACVLHALSVEKEEVMGLLIGKFDDNNEAYISTIMVTERSDKRKDRVEISPEQLHAAMTKASDVSERTGEVVNVVGWYHSHPHITVQPSHVDLRTQATNQLMDKRFVGIILSVFNEDKNKGQEIQTTCFQAARPDGGPFEMVQVPLYIEPVDTFGMPCLEAMFELPMVVHKEDQANYDKVKNTTTSFPTKLQNDAAYVMAQCHIMKNAVNPLMLNAELQLRAASAACRKLQQERDELRKQLDRLDLQ